jgi:hypothetical protein
MATHADSDDGQRCPLEPVDRRLEDCHRQWHEADQAYFDPDDFRFRIQGCVQTLRTVTFILQKHKALIPDFDRWYGEWQDQLRSDPLMSWMVDARNRIEKQGDLELHSVVRAEILASYVDGGPITEVPAKLFDGPHRLLQNIPTGAMGEHVKEHGVLRIQRRWVENSLPNLELLEAVAVAYGKISTLLDDAHRQLGDRQRGVVNQTTGEVYAPGDRGGRLPCMIGHDADRTLLLRIKDGVRLSLAEKSINISAEDEAAITESFPLKPDEVFPPPGATPEETLKSLFRAAIRVFEKDGYHETIAFLPNGSRPLRIIGLRPEDQTEKYLIMRRLGIEALRVGADGVILLGEMWSAQFNAAKPYRRAADAPDKTEHLTATLVQKDGDPVQLMAQIERSDAGPRLGQTIEQRGASLWSYVPIYQAWGRPIPESWKDPTTSSR